MSDAATRLAPKVEGPESWSRRGRVTAILLLIGFVLLAVAYSLVVPPFETPDEIYHYGFVRHLAEGNELPVQNLNALGPWEQEGSQAPLYYWLAGQLTSGIDQGDFDQWGVRNPRANIGNPLYPGNKNFMLYSGAPRALEGANLALHVGRWLSAALGIITLVATLWLARCAFAGRKLRRLESLSLATMALVAAVPQFAFLSGSLSNDALVTAVATLTVAWLAVLTAREASAQIFWWEWGVLGVLLGLAALSKLQGLGLFLLAALAGVGIMWQRRDWSLPLRALLPVAVPPLLIAGWWYLRNLRLYGDWSGLQHLLEINGRRPSGFGFADWWIEFRGLRYSFWGLFGWFNILLPDWVYWVLDGVTVLGLSGALPALLWHWRRTATESERAARRVLVLALAWVLISFALLAYWTLQATGSQGRLLFPAMSALAVLVVLGLDFWTARLAGRLRGGLFAALLGLLVGSSLYALTVLLPDSYRPVAPVATLPPSAVSLDLRFETSQTAAATIELVGVEVAADRVKAGESLPLTLYLRADEQPAADLQLFLQLLDEEGQELANITTHPGWGRNPTSLWQANALYADAYELPVTVPVENWSPVRARLYVGFIDPATSETGNLPLPAISRSVGVVTPFVGEVTVLPSQPVTAEDLGLKPIGVGFGNVIRAEAVGLPDQTEAVAPGETVTVTLLYAAEGRPATSYSAFVHLVNGDGEPVAGFDHPPAGARFDTAHWRADDRVVSTFPLVLPSDLAPGEYVLWSGLYESANVGALLPVTDAAALPSGDGRVQIGLLRVE